jgi:aminocarboxymuconate-semialdehyde decarboxylase
MAIIDFHSHVVPQEYPPPPRGVDEPSWPVMQRVDGLTVSMMIAGKEYRRFGDIYWDAERRIEVLDREGIDSQVVSPLPELLSYWLKSEAAYALTEFMNGVVAKLVERAPARFIGLGAVALQSPDIAARQLEHLKRDYRLRGVQIGSNVNGVSIAAPQFESFFAAAESLGLLIFVHGFRPAGTERLVGSPLLAPIVGVPQETCMAISSLIMTDILGKFPRLKLVFAHGGGTLGSVLNRVDHVWRNFPAMQAQVGMSPVEYARRFYYDTVTFGPAYVRYLADSLGVERLLGGTDGPTEVGQKDFVRFMRDTGMSERERRLILGGNAERLLAELS